MPNRHFMRVNEVAKEYVSVDRLACRFHPDQALEVREQKRSNGDAGGELKILVSCPICMHVAHSHEERERASMTLATEMRSDEPDRALRAAG